MHAALRASVVWGTVHKCLTHIRVFYSISGTCARFVVCCVRYINSKMTRSLKKGPYVDEKLLKKIEGKRPSDIKVIKTWARASLVSPEMVGFTFGVHNGREHIPVLITEEMVGHRLGEFSQTRKFFRHGGKMQKEIEQKKREAEIAAAKAAKTAA